MQTYTEKAIKKAIESGYKEPMPDRVLEHLSGLERQARINYCLLDPFFWQALGIGLGNKDVMRCDSPRCDYVQCEYAGYKEPRRMSESFMSNIWDGGTPESFFESLLSK